MPELQLAVLAVAVGVGNGTRSARPLHHLDAKDGSSSVPEVYRKAKTLARLTGYLQKHLGEPGGVEGVQHPAHVAIVEEVGVMLGVVGVRWACPGRSGRRGEGDGHGALGFPASPGGAERQLAQKGPERAHLPLRGR